MEKEYVIFDDTNIKQNLSKMDLYEIQNKKEFCEKKLEEKRFSFPNG